VTTIAERGQDAATAASGEECEAIWEFLGIEAPCGQPAVGRFRRICVHEHVRDGWLCPDHAENPQNGLCGTCYFLPGDLSHECPIGMTELTS
jgi:hypothetical protein